MKVVAFFFVSVLHLIVQQENTATTNDDDDNNNGDDNDDDANDDDKNNNSNKPRNADLSNDTHTCHTGTRSTCRFRMDSRLFGSELQGACAHSHVCRHRVEIESCRAIGREAPHPSSQLAPDWFR